MADTVYISLRVPAELAKRIEARCLVRKMTRTAAILEAIEDSFGGIVQRAELTTGGNACGEKDAGSSPAPAPKPDMQALRDICAGRVANIQPVSGTPVFLERPVQHFDVESLMQPVEIPICGKTWWEEGEQWECLMDKGHKEAKHGLRGMVRSL